MYVRMLTDGLGAGHKVHTFGQKGWRSMLDAASQGLQEASHRSSSLEYTVCCPINRTLRAVGSRLHIQWLYCVHGMAHVFHCCTGVGQMTENLLEYIGSA